MIYYRRSNSRFAEISCDIFPGKQGVSETPAAVVFTTTVVNYYDRSIFSMVGSFGGLSTGIVATSAHLPMRPSSDTFLGLLSHHLKCEMKSLHLVDFSWDLVDSWSNLSRILAAF